MTQGWVDIFPPARPVPCARCGRPVDAVRAPLVRITPGRSYYFCCLEHGEGCDLSSLGAWQGTPAAAARRAPGHRGDPGLPPGGTSRQPAGADSATTGTGPSKLDPGEPPQAQPPQAQPQDADAKDPSPSRPDRSDRTGELATRQPALGLAPPNHRPEKTRVSDWAAPLLSVALVIACALFRPESLATTAPLAGVVVTWALLSTRLARWLGRTTLAHQSTYATLLSHPAHRLEEGTIRVVSGYELRAGEELELKAGEVLVVDAVVLSGNGLVEPFPGGDPRWPVEEGLRLPAGARLLRGRLRVVCAIAANECTWQRYAFGEEERSAWLVRSAERVVREVSPAVSLVSFGLGYWWTGSILTAASVAVANLAALGNPLLVQLLRSIVRKWVGALADRGVHLAPQALDDAAGVTQCVLCARGTVLSGEPEVAEIHALRDLGEDDVLALAAGAESVVEHPVASSILRAAHARGIGPDRARGHDVAAGLGVVCFSSDGHELVVGSRDLLLRQRISIARAEELLRRLESRGRIGILVAKAGSLVGVLALHDALRVGAKAAVQLLIDGHIEPVLLSGDTRATSEALGHALSVEHVRPEVPARERGAEVKRLASGGATVAVVGHSPLDDSALSGASTPILLDAAAQPLRPGTIAVLGSSVQLAAEALLSLQRLRHEGLVASAVAFLTALLGVLSASSLLFPPVIAPILTILGGLFASFWVYWHRQDCSPSPRYGRPGS